MREAEVSITDTEFEAMGVDELLSVFRAANLLEVEAFSCRGNGAILQIKVRTTVDEDRLQSLDCVDQWTPFVADESAHLYMVSFTSPDLPESLAGMTDSFVGTCDPVVDDHGATMSLVGPHDAISGQLNEYADVGVSPKLERINGWNGPTHPLDEFTDRQCEVIDTAWENGSYEVPKETTAEDVAAALDFHSSTVNEHLQHAERNLPGRLL